MEKEGDCLFILSWLGGCLGRCSIDVGYFTVEDLDAVKGEGKVRGYSLLVCHDWYSTWILVEKMFVLMSRRARFEGSKASNY